MRSKDGFPSPLEAERKKNKIKIINMSFTVTVNIKKTFKKMHLCISFHASYAIYAALILRKKNILFDIQRFQNKNACLYNSSYYSYCLIISLGLSLRI